MILASVHLTESYYLTFAAVLFTIGAVGLLIRRNVLVMFMCVELMLNAVNLTFVAFSKQYNDVGGQLAVFFVLVVAVVGGVVLARRSGLPAEQEYDLERDDDHTTPSDLDPEDSSTEVTTP